LCEGPTQACGQAELGFEFVRAWPSRVHPQHGIEFRFGSSCRRRAAGAPGASMAAALSGGRRADAPLQFG